MRQATLIIASVLLLLSPVTAAPLTSNAPAPSLPGDHDTMDGSSTGDFLYNAVEPIGLAAKGYTTSALFCTDDPAPPALAVDWSLPRNYLTFTVSARDTVANNPAFYFCLYDDGDLVLQEFSYGRSFYSSGVSADQVQLHFPPIYVEYDESYQIGSLRIPKDPDALRLTAEAAPYFYFATHGSVQIVVEG